MPPRARLRIRVLTPFLGLALLGAGGLTPASADDTPAPVAVEFVE